MSAWRLQRLIDFWRIPIKVPRPFGSVVSPSDRIRHSRHTCVRIDEPVHVPLLSSDLPASVSSLSVVHFNAAYPRGKTLGQVQPLFRLF